MKALEWCPSQSCTCFGLSPARKTRVAHGRGRVGGRPAALLAAFFLLAVLVAVLLSISALALEEFSFRRHPKAREVMRMLAFAILENFGYRQLLGLFRGLGLVDVIRRRRGWGEMRRRGLGHSLSSHQGGEQEVASNFPGLAVQTMNVPRAPMISKPQAADATEELGVREIEAVAPTSREGE